jgi:starch synthase
MAQGIANSDLVSTVSKQYAKDILKPEAGSGLDLLLKERKDRLHGVVNGIDYDLWNPATDPHIAQHFDRSSLKMRAVNKAALQQEARLPTRPDTPLIGMVTRLDYLKGIDLLQPVLSRLLEGDIQFVILGTGTEEYHEILEGLQSRYSDKMRAFLRYDDPLARRIYAGSDIFLMPSRFEPCGLGQMIAMHYGAVPVVHRTGGLSDTVTDYDQRPKKATGFVLSPLTPKSLTNSLERALDVFRDRDAWTELQKRGMKTDFSWQASAKKYVKLYRQIVELRHKV